MALTNSTGNPTTIYYLHFQVDLFCFCFLQKFPFKLFGSSRITPTDTNRLGFDRKIVRELHTLSLVHGYLVSFQFQKFSLYELTSGESEKKEVAEGKRLGQMQLSAL